MLIKTFQKSTTILFITLVGCTYSTQIFAEDLLPEKCIEEAKAFEKIRDKDPDKNSDEALKYLACMIKEYSNQPEPPPWSFYAAYGEKVENLQHLIGKSYKEARTEILSSGWKIFDSNLSDEDINRSKNLWELGYHELEACTGGGDSYCSFIFINDQGKKLRIVVKGEREPNFRVLYVNILPEDYK